MQFGLSTLFLLFVVLWSSLALFGGWGIGVFIVAVALALYIYHCDHVWSRAEVAVLPLVLLSLMALLLPSVKSARDTSPSSICADNMKQIGLALHNYRQANGCFPPAYVADKNGKPMHSWRVLILPYLGLEARYKHYNFNEPWDGPNNSKFLNLCQMEYVCDSDQHGPPMNASIGYVMWAYGRSLHTNYAAVVGANAAWPGGKPGKLSGDLSRTILLVEVTDGNIQWTEPKDVSLDALLAASPGCITVSSKHLPKDEFFFYTPRAGANVALADGSVRFLPGDLLASDKFPDLLKIGGFREEYLDAKWPFDGRKIHWPHCLTFATALGVWLASSGWLMVRAVRSRKAAAEHAAENAG